MKIGEKYLIMNIGGDMIRRVEILSRAGKANGKYTHAYNVRPK